MKSENKILQTKIEKLKETIGRLQKEKRESVKWLDSADIKMKFNISDTTLWRLRKNDKIPYNKIGNKFVYPDSFFNKSMLKTIKNSHLL